MWPQPYAVPPVPAIPLSKEPVAPSFGPSLWPMPPIGFGLNNFTDPPALLPCPPLTQNARVGVPWGPLADCLPHTCSLPSTHTHLFILEYVRERRELKMIFALKTNKAMVPNLERQEQGLYLGVLGCYGSFRLNPSHRPAPQEKQGDPGKANSILSICPFPLPPWGVGGVRMHSKRNFVR
ncbi:Hypothetical predicted protein [Marmota monax]|uniref:Uncharacterized protein n=1 Tax=Marmota monax TaxID=9995 RepID=A0A5E4A8H8_MARMO|nr:hypothetical protein GHT09_010571 [Marmota monax]VTJ53345.1 Hypothetical predicted protein [Marmota monax]